jgi:hypothetical protein
MRLLRALDFVTGVGWTLFLVVLRVMVLVTAAALIWLLLSGRLIGP